ncbi:hypothetical protein [Brucella anthropi]|uniref:hypothetical protein n=1 Tax=Brucella anthropi TaxID=529 RepID=UPI001AEEFB32|nr:hypothetical protein [Brucella anthropi]
MNTIVGPFPDAERLLALSFDIARYLGGGTTYLIKALSNCETENNSAFDSFINFSTAFLDAIEPFKNRANKPDIPVLTT